MAAVKIKKLTIISSREDIENILRELIALGCFEVSEPHDLLAGLKLPPGFSLEILPIDHLGAGKESIELLGTQHTIMLSGWITSRSEASVESKLENSNCTWEIEIPSAEESMHTPVDLCCPNFFGKLRRGGRRQFVPLVTKTRKEA